MRSLRSRLPFLAVVLISGVLVVFTWTAYAQMVRALVDSGRTRAASAANELVNLLAPAAQQRASEMKRVAADEVIRTALAEPADATREAAEAALKRLMSTGQQIVELWDADGRRVAVLASSATVAESFPPPSAPSGSRLRLARGTGGLVVSDAIEPVEGHLGHIVVRRPVATSSPDVLNRLVGAGASIRIGGVNGQWTDLTQIVPASPIETGGPGVGEYRAASGEARIAAVAEIKNTPWLVAVEFPRDLFLAPAQTFLLRIGAAAVVLAVIAGVVTRITAARITAPLRELTEVSEGIAAGDFTRRAGREGDDELGRLGAAFNSMVGQIDDAQRKLRISRDEAVEQARHAAFSAEIAIALTEGGDAATMLGRCARAIVEHLDARIVRVWTVSQAEPVLELEASAGDGERDDEPVRRLPIGAMTPGRAALTGTPVVDGDVAPGSYIDEGVAAGAAIRSYAVYPLSLDDRVIGVVGMLTSTPADTRTQEALASKARTIALGIERKRLDESKVRAEKERQELQEQLERAQKIEAIGQLAGGLAHDFNNLLTIILGFTNVLDDQIAKDDPCRADIEQIRRAGDRASQLTRQLLAFSRRQILNPVVLNPNVLIEDVRPMLSRLAGESVEVVTNFDPMVSSIRFDPTQMELILVNLTVNARDAMPHGGRLTIETADVDLDEEFCRTHLSVEPGRYVRLSMTDTGTGIDAETKKHIFEPFFTTKGRDKGTGLGLATVFGIVKQSGGSVWVYSEPGLGASFKLFLPVAAGAAASAQERTRPAATTGHETILVVEDEAGVRQLVQKVLKRDGYDVLSCPDPRDAIALVNESPRRIDLLVTDVIMPHMNGAALARELSRQRPSLRTIFMSGFDDDAIERHGVAAAGAAFLQKPFTASDLSRKVRDVLDGAA